MKKRVRIIKEVHRPDLGPECYECFDTDGISRGIIDYGSCYHSFINKYHLMCHGN